MKLKNLSFLIVIVLLATILRFFRLGDVPNGLYQDETAIGYNAYSIIETGKDEYGKSYPLYFKSFGDQKLPVYIYTTTPFVKLFGLTPFAIRFPSALFGVLSVIALYFFIRDLSRNNNLALLSSLFLAINPWSLFYNRATFEVSMSLFFFILGGFLLNKFFREKVKGALVLGTLCFIVSLYSYNLTRLLAPVLFALFIIINRNDLKKVSKKEAVLTVAVGILSIIPFAASLLKSGGVSSASGTLIFSSAVVQAQIRELRSYMIGLPLGMPALFFNKFLLTAWQYLINIASYFSADFFFIRGSLHGNHGIGNVGLFYLFELPLIFCGVVSLIRRKIPGVTLLFGWGIATILVAALTREAPHATRSFFLVIPLTVFSAAGAISLYKYIFSKRANLLKYGVLVIVLGIVFFNLTYYFSSYYVRFPLLYAKAFRLHDRELSNYLFENDKRYEKVIIDKDAGFIYTSLLFYSKYPPADFQKSVRRAPDDPEGFSRVLSFGKYEFRSIDWESDSKLANTLLITLPEKKPENLAASHTIYYPVRPIAFAENQRIFQLPVNDKAYVLVETK